MENSVLAAGSGNWSMLAMLIVLFAFFYLFTRSSKKQLQKKEEERGAWLVVGTNVVTTSGFLGTIVDIDGDAVTLQSPSGDETVWLAAAINRPMDLPLAGVAGDSQTLQNSQDDTKNEDDVTERDSGDSSK